MTSVAEIAVHTARIGEKAESVSRSLELEAQEIASLMSRIQLTFGDQLAGQEAVAQLYHALTNLNAAGSSMRALKAHSENFIARLLS